VGDKIGGNSFCFMERADFIEKTDRFFNIGGTLNDRFIIIISREADDGGRHVCKRVCYIFTA
jgi:hypothetical protein